MTITTTTGGNYFVLVPEAGNGFKFISAHFLSVHATNSWGHGEIPYCLTDDAPGGQAQCSSCSSPARS